MQEVEGSANTGQCRKKGSVGIYQLDLSAYAEGKNP